VVLDEADEMLDMGFAEDLEAILARAPSERQTALFSATLPARILGIAQQSLRDPVRVTIARERAEPGETPRVRQVAYVVPRSRKDAALARILDMEAPTSAILFCRTRLEVDELTEAMNARGYRAEALHGGFAQEQRDRVMKRFRSGKSDLLVATDVAARGLDVEHVSHVVNYDVPLDPDDYVHRIGRTGRAGREGVAITLVTPREKRVLENIRRATRQYIPIESVPSASDLETRRLERTREAVLEALESGDLEGYRAVALDLAASHDPVDVAAAALKLARSAGRGEDEEPEEDFEWRPPARQERRDDRESHQRGRPPFERGHGGHGGHGGPGGHGGHERPSRKGPPSLRAQGVDSVRLFVGAGRAASLRPGDLVGAITNEAGVPGSAIGQIHISERHSLVEVRAEVADAVLRALRSTTLRGRKVNVRPDKY
jgi:ATP-dependent RNA helicase DeaD